MGFSRQEYGSRLPFPSSGDLPNPGVKPKSSAVQGDSLPSEPPGPWQYLACCAVLCSVTQSCPTLWDPVDWLIYPRGSPGKNTGVGCHAILQGIFPTQGSNSGLLHCWQIFFYHLSHQGSLRILEWVDYPIPGDLLDPGIEPGSPALQVDSIPPSYQGSPIYFIANSHSQWKIQAVYL